MRTIWKFPFEIQDAVRLTMPVGAKILTISEQSGQPILWAEVDPDAEREARELRIFGTGHPILGELGPYVGTFSEGGGRLVWHIYEAA